VSTLSRAHCFANKVSSAAWLAELSQLASNVSTELVVDNKREGFGLANMRERASEIDGRLEIQTAAGDGTSIIVTVPISSFQPSAGLGERTVGPLF
jgi:glucose-6-phosphate-specific signal transduction histidine kinase